MSATARNHNPTVTDKKSPQSISVEDISDFHEYVRKRPRSFYIGGFRKDIDENKTYRFVSTRGPKISQVSVLWSKKHDAAVVRLNVEDDANVSLLDEPLFWPNGVVCRPWVTRFKSKRFDKRSRLINSTRASMHITDSAHFGSQSDFIDTNPYRSLSTNQL